VLSGAAVVLRRRGWSVSLVSALLIVPCLWHPHIEAGDLGSHVYNAWLAQLIGKGQAPGLYFAPQWNNVLFDLMLLHTVNSLGFAAAQKVVVSACVLLFFWGAFAFVTAVAGQPPWALTPGLALVAYGYSFNMGFFNYYLSIALGCLFLALVWRGWNGGGVARWIAAGVLAVLTMFAHPMGICWIAGALLYRWLRERLPGWWKLTIPLAELFAYRVALLFAHRRNWQVDWHAAVPFYQLNGSDQLNLYGDRYVTLAWVTLFFSVACFALEAWMRRQDRAYWSRVAFPLELYALLCVTTFAVPENLRVGVYAAWIGLLESRLTTVVAIAGLCVLACGKPRWWHTAGFGAIGAVFFTLLYQDTGKLNVVETNAEQLVASLPVGTRVVPTVAADPDWRIEFIAHIVDRTCVQRCFVFSNYEPSSRQFRVRVVEKGSWLVTPSAENADDMQGGSYEIERGDLPLTHIYQCDREDWTKLCAKELKEGENTGTGWVRPE